MQPATLCEKFSTEQIRTWFDSADTDGSGSLSVNEFFAWSLGNAVGTHGMRPAHHGAHERPRMPRTMPDKRMKGFL